MKCSEKNTALRFRPKIGFINHKTKLIKRIWYLSISMLIYIWNVLVDDFLASLQHVKSQCMPWLIVISGWKKGGAKSHRKTKFWYNKLQKSYIVNPPDIYIDGGAYDANDDFNVRQVYFARYLLQNLKSYLSVESTRLKLIRSNTILTSNLLYINGEWRIKMPWIVWKLWINVILG